MGLPGFRSFGLDLKAVCWDQSLHAELLETFIRLSSDFTTTIACISRCFSTNLSLLTVVAQFFE